jgi:protein SCO1
MNDSPIERKTSMVVIIVLVFAALATGTMAFRQIIREAKNVAASPSLPILGQVPFFTLLRQNDKPLNLEGLSKSVWVADFVFTRCAGPCPMMTQRMAELHRVLSGLENVRFVSFSVDPDHDTPEVLTRYGEAYDADFDRWAFLTGDREAIYKLGIEGFKLAIGEDPSNEHFILHSTKFTLVDRKGRIRGYYDGNDAKEMTRLVADIQKLATDPPK